MISTDMAFAFDSRCYANGAFLTVKELTRSCVPKLSRKSTGFFEFLVTFYVAAADTALVPIFGKIGELLMQKRSKLRAPTTWPARIVIQKLHHFGNCLV